MKSLDLFCYAFNNLNNVATFDSFRLFYHRFCVSIAQGSKEILVMLDVGIFSPNLIRHGVTVQCYGTTFNKIGCTLTAAEN